jgi:hypothetical protein
MELNKTAVRKLAQEWGISEDLVRAMHAIVTTAKSLHMSTDEINRMLATLRTSAQNKSKALPQQKSGTLIDKAKRIAGHPDLTPQEKAKLIDMVVSGEPVAISNYKSQTLDDQMKQKSSSVPENKSRAAGDRIPERIDLTSGRSLKQKSGFSASELATKSTPKMKSAVNKSHAVSNPLSDMDRDTVIASILKSNASWSEKAQAIAALDRVSSKTGFTAAAVAARTTKWSK